MKKALLLFFFSFTIVPFAFSQDSCSLRISLLTCAPGEELYSTFGHTAIRVQDAHMGLDQVYNYGTFEFNPEFYSKFVLGKLLYYLSVQDFADFMYQYRVESRSVIEQELNLNCQQRSRLYDALQVNAHPDNRDYLYDFLFDNCTTRAKDMIAGGSGVTVQFGNILPGQKPTFRNLIHVYLNRANQHWSKLGIDMLLGAKMDRRATNEEAMFLPDNLMEGLDSAHVAGVPLVKEKKTILEMPNIAGESKLVTPFAAFSLLLLVAAILSFTKKSWAQTAVSVVDFLFFFTLGVAGVVMLFMWLGTDHALCANNYNLLWALPSHLVLSFFVHRKRAWVQQYFRIIMGFSILLLIAWTFLPQQMHPAFLPVVVLAAFRSWFLSKNETPWR